MSTSLAITEPVTNKLNVYLIKKEYKSYENIIKDGIEITATDIGVGVLYHTKSLPQPPDWLRLFFKNDERIPKEHFWVSGTTAVLLCKVNLGRIERYFAIPFGSGRFLLKDHVTEDRFGLITAVNVAEEDKIRSIDKRVLASNTKLTKEQLSKVGTTSDFGIDIERDLLHGITAQTNIGEFGKTVTGKDAFSFSAKADTSNILYLLKRCYVYYNKQSYKSKFPWLDLIKEVKEPAEILILNQKLIELIKSKPDDVWLAVPEIIEWSEIAGFKYSLRKKDTMYDDLTISDFLSETELGDTLQIDNLFSCHISCCDQDGTNKKKEWNVFQCLNIEIYIGRKLYILTNGKWYDVAPTFVNEIDQEVNKIPKIKIDFPAYEHSDESEYNLALTTYLKGYCLDTKNIIYGGGRSKIEFCDVLAPGNRIIHAKKYGGSSVLSHLFNQGYVSAELMARDVEFRKLVRDKISVPSFKKMVPIDKPDASQYNIVFAIIGSRSKTGEIKIPFFSKVTLRRCYSQLRGFNFKVFVNFIPLKE